MPLFDVHCLLKTSGSVVLSRSILRNLPKLFIVIT